MLSHLVQRSNSIALSAFTPLLLAFAPQDPSFNPPSLDLTLGNGEVQQHVIEVCIPGETNVSMADVFLLADSTGSMGSEIAQVQTDAALILNTLLGDPNIDFQIGVGDYKDFSHLSFLGGGGPDPYAFQLAQPISDDAALINSAIDDWDADGGNDLPEGQLFAFDRLVNDPAIGWRPGAKRIIVFFGDAPGHDPVCAAISGLAYEITEASVIADLQGAGPGGTTIIGVSSGGGLNDSFDSGDYTSDCGYSISGSGQADRIADGTGGLVEEIGNPAEVTTAILDAIMTVLTEVDVSLNPTGGIAGLVTSIDPPSHSIVLPDDPTEEICVSFTVTFEGYCVSDPADADPSASLDLHLDGVPTPFGVPTDAHLDVCDDPGGSPGDELNRAIFAGLDVDIQTSHVYGTIAAGNDLSVETCNLGLGVSPEDTDSMIADRDLYAHIGLLDHGNVVAGNSLNIEPTFGLAGGTLPPRIDSVVDFSAVTNFVTAVTTTLGALVPTGTVVEREDNLDLTAHNGDAVEIFLVTAAQLEAARHVTIEVDAGSAALVNIEGGNVNPVQFGIELVGVTPDLVLFNAFEASQVYVADVNFDGSLVAQGGDVDIAEIDVKGQLVAGGNISIQTSTVWGQLFSGDIDVLLPFMGGVPMQEPVDVLLHNLVLTPSMTGNVTVAPLDGAQGSPLAVTVDGIIRHFRSEKIGRLTVAGITDHSVVDVDPSLGLDVHYLEDAPLGGDDVYMLKQMDVPRRGRGMILMDLFANDLAGSSGLDMSSFRVVTRPEHGVVRHHEPSGRVWFAWGSAKWTEDSFEYLMLDGNGVASEPVSVRILR